MRKIFMLAIMIACAAPAAFAQDDYNKYDVYVGYSHNRVDIGVSDDDPDVDDIVDEREGFHGIEFSAKGALSRYVGLKGDYAYHRKSFNAFGANVDANLHTLVGGVEFKDNSKETKVKPFAHAMIGVGHANVEVEDFDFDQSETGLAGVIGGGIDFRVSERVDFRAIQFDWNPARGGGQTTHNFRIGIGIVFR